MTDDGPGSRSRRFAWISRDARIIIAARSLRTAAQASIAVFIGIYLSLLGFSFVQIGVFISLGLAGSAFFATLIALFGNAFGRRRLLTLFTLFTGVAGVVLVFTDHFLLLAAVVFVASFNAAGGSAGGPVQPLEQSVLPETVPSEKRTDLFAVYGIVAMIARAVGTLAAGLPTVFQHALGMDELASYRVMFGAFAALATITAILYTRLSSNVEIASVQRGWTNPFKLPSRKRIFAMAALFSLDTFATRLVVQSLVALWLFERFGVEVAAIAALFFFTDALQAVSMWVAAKLANRFGLLNVVVLSHVPAVLLVTLIPFMPSASLVAAAWLARGFFSHMDGPTRQSYTMGVVSREERTAMAGLNHMSQNIAGAASPSIATLLWSLWAGFPFVGSAAVKLVYLVAFYTMFRNIRPPEEQHRMAEREAAAPRAR